MTRSNMSVGQRLEVLYQCWPGQEENKYSGFKLWPMAVTPNIVGGHGKPTKIGSPVPMASQY